MNFFDTTVTPEAKKMVMKCLDSGMLSEGKLVKEFESLIETEFGYSNCVSVNSGTSALHLSLILSNIIDGDEVILPAQTFVATGLAILYCGGIPVFADIDRKTGNISVEDVWKKVTINTKAVIGVAWGGSPCDVDGLKEMRESFRDDIAIIQDNAQALGAKHVESDFTCFSFQAIKHLTTGDGGAIICKDNAVQEAKRLRWFGIDREKDSVDSTGERRYNLNKIGYKYHMNDYSAALGIGNMQGFWIRQKIRNKIAQVYDDKLPKELQIEHNGSANWLYTILVDRRNSFMRRMKEKNIPVSVVHIGIDRNDIFGSKSDLPNQRYWDKHHVCLPIHPGLTEEDVNKVIEAINEGW